MLTAASWWVLTAAQTNPTLPAQPPPSHAPLHPAPALQRIHDPALLTERAEALGLPVETIQSYLDSFK